MEPMDLPETLALVLERADAAACADFARACPPAFAAEAGIGVETLGGVVAALAARADVLALNRVIHLGVEAPATEALVDGVIDVYRRAGVPRFFVQLSPYARPAALPRWLAARGLVCYNHWMKLYRGVDDVPAVDTALRVVAVDAVGAGDFARIVTGAFDMPAALEPWMAAAVGRPGWRHYLACDGAEPVATAALYVDGEAGWMGFASTLPAWRRRGAQSALIARRLHDARALGCRYVVVETADDLPDRRAPSFHNLSRLGFRLAYRRPNYLWRAAAGAVPTWTG